MSNFTRHGVLGSRMLRSIALACAATSVATVAEASYAFYVGKDLTESGWVIIGGTGEEVSSHWLEIVGPATHEDGATVTVGITEEASRPGALFEIPQVPETFRYLSMS